MYPSWKGLSDTVKQRYRAIRHGLPYVTMPSLMVINLAIFVYFWLTAFCPKDGVSDEVIPWEVIGAWVLDFNEHCRAQIGGYVQNHEENYPKNKNAV